MTQSEKNLIIDHSVQTIDALFTVVDKRHIWPTITNLVSEFLVEGKLPSINWFSSRELRKYNSAQGIGTLERKVALKILDEIRNNDPAAWAEWKEIWIEIEARLVRKGRLTF